MLKLIKLFKQNKFVERVMVQINMSVTTTRLIRSMTIILFLLHLVGCLWVTVALLNPYEDPVNWLTYVNL